MVGVAAGGVLSPPLHSCCRCRAGLFVKLLQMFPWVDEPL